tara:strand:+ start:265 stop:750 length:486 start_codon:yes stop_codon:yes gene_type:complete
MKESKVFISKITYYKKEDIRILNACLSDWLSAPKILHFTEPRMTYPFNIKKWITLSYKEKDIETIIIKIENWIVGHLSIKYEEDKNSAYFFHLIIDQTHLRKGYAKKLMTYAEKYLNNKIINEITLDVVKKNQKAIQLYHSLGYKETKGRNKAIIKMEKNI